MASVEETISQQLAEVSSKLTTAEDNIRAYVSGYMSSAYLTMSFAEGMLRNHGADGIFMARLYLTEGMDYSRRYQQGLSEYIRIYLWPVRDQLSTSIRNLITIVQGLIAAAGAAAYDFFFEQINSVKTLIMQAFDVTVSAVQSSVSGVVLQLDKGIQYLMDYFNKQLADITSLLLPAINNVAERIAGLVGRLPAQMAQLLIDAFLEEEPA